MNNRPRSRSLAQWLLPLASNTEALRCELLFPVRPRGEHLQPCMMTEVEMQVRRSAVTRALGIDRFGTGANDGRRLPVWASCAAGMMMLSNWMLVETGTNAVSVAPTT